MPAAAALLSLVLSADPLQLATVGFSQVGLSDAEASFYAEHFSVQLQSVDPGALRVTTQKDMAAILGNERQKQLLGCADDQTSCMAELAGALGADGLVTGQVAKVGKRFQVNVKILASDGSRTLFLHSSKLLGDEEDLVRELNETARQAVEALRAQLRPADGAVAGSAPPAGVTASSSGSRNWLKLLPIAAGAGGLVLASLAFVNSAERYRRLNDSAGWSELDPLHAQSMVREGKESLGIGAAIAVAGLVIIAASVLWYLLT